MQKELSSEQRARIRYVLEDVQANVITPGRVISLSDPLWGKLDDKRRRGLDEATHSHLDARLRAVLEPPKGKRK